ncbi:MAG: helix-turn-helix transcriptional regulator [Enterocloster sp.]
MNSVTTNSKWLKVDGKKLYEKRRKKNYTREKLSEISGVSENSIKRLEQGIENCMLSTLGKLADALDVLDISELLIKEEQKNE